MATGKTKIEAQDAPTFKSERLYNEDLAPARERRWTGYSVFAIGGEAFRGNTERLRDGVSAAKREG